MRRRYIALKPASKHWDFAVAQGDSSEATLLQTGQFKRDESTPLVDQLTEFFGPLQTTDRLAYALPAHTALLRWLEFPFSEPRKVAAATPPELERQLPQSIADRTIYQFSQSEGKTLAVAVKTEEIEAVLARFDDNLEPLGYLGLSPFCHVAGLNWPVDSLLLCQDEQEISISRVEDGHITDLRVLPHTMAIDNQLVLQQVQILARGGQAPLLRLRLLGIAPDSSLTTDLEQAEFEIETVKLDSLDGRGTVEQSAVASLALAATVAKTGDLNLRSGLYKLKNEWQVVKRRGWIAAGMLMFSIFAFSVNGYLEHHQRSTQLANLQEQMSNLYKQQFPGEKLVVAAPLQLESRLKELQKKSQQFGAETPGALQTLKTLSAAVDPSLSVDIREYLYTNEGLRLTGSTRSFDSISQLLAGLQKEPLLREVRILDSKQAIDGSRVEFQLQVQLQNSAEK